MIGGRCGLAIVVAAAVVAGCGASGTPRSAATTTGPTTTSPPPVVDNCGGAAYQPTTLYIVCGQAKLTATEIKWRSWTPQQAQGSATMSVIVQGHEELLPAEVTLTDPKPTSSGLEFSSATVAWSATSPNGKPVETYPLQTG